MRWPAVGGTSAERPYGNSSFERSLALGTVQSRQTTPTLIAATSFGLWFGKSLI